MMQFDVFKFKEIRESKEKKFTFIFAAILEKKTKFVNCFYIAGQKFQLSKKKLQCRRLMKKPASAL